MSTASSSERTGSRAPPVSVATTAHAVAGAEQVVVQVGTADVELLAVADAGLRGRPRRGHRSGEPASTGRRRRRGTSIVASKPPRVRNRSALARMHADGRTKTSRTASCCSWSYSPGSVIGSISPNRSRPSPTCWSTPGSSQETNLGPTKPAFERYSSSTSRRTASGSRATSSWQNRKKPPSPSTRRSTSLAAAPKPGLAPRSRTNASGSRAVISASRPSMSPAASRNSVLRLG